MNKLAITLIMILTFAPVTVAQENAVIKKLQDTLNKQIEEIKEMKKELNRLKNIKEDSVEEELKSFNVKEHRVSTNDSYTQSKYIVKNEDNYSKSKFEPIPLETQYAKVKIINEYHLDYKVLVNDEEYTIKAGETQTVNYIIPGEFTYRVIGIHNDDQMRDISPKETFTIRIYPKKSS